MEINKRNLCRTCNHEHNRLGYHYGFTEDGNPAMFSCTCINYIPLDNLDYLEWLILNEK